MNTRPVALVTGAYRGLGYETCRQLAELDHRIILTARRREEGELAAASLRQAGLDVVYHYLDVTDDGSIQELRGFIQREYGRLDILVNNAGIFPDPAPWEEQSSVFDADPEVVRMALETNTIGPLRLCQSLIPMMEGEGRVVNVSSGMGQLSEMNACCPGYRLSKTALNAVTRVFSEELKATDIKVNSVCPGWVRTEMGGSEAPLSVSEGAKGIVWAATLPADGPSGGFFRGGEPISW